jgi:putative phosphoesterase
LKIGILSDLHIDQNTYDKKTVLEGMVESIKSNKVDLMMIAGDISNNYEISLEFINNLERNTGISCIFIPGNHDIWNEFHPNKNAWDIYEEYRKHPGNIANGPINLKKDWVVLGDMGWYDYSFGSKEFSKKDFDEMHIDDRTWQDKIKAMWDRETVEMHKYFYKKIKNQVDENLDKNIIMMTHVVTHKNFTVQNPNHMWKYLNAFLGSEDYGKLVIEKNIKYSIFGHVHYRMEEEIENSKFICNCLGTMDEWQGRKNPVEEVMNTFKVINI